VQPLCYTLLCDALGFSHGGDPPCYLAKEYIRVSGRHRGTMAGLAFSLEPSYMMVYGCYTKRVTESLCRQKPDKCAGDRVTPSLLAGGDCTLLSLLKSRRPRQ